MNNPVKNRIVKFNVGGKVFTTTTTTLDKHEGTYLYNVVNTQMGEEIEDENGCYFIDRDPDYFHYVLTYLRTRMVSILPNDEKKNLHPSLTRILHLNLARNVQN